MAPSSIHATAVLFNIAGHDHSQYFNHIIPDFSTIIETSNTAKGSAKVETIPNMMSPGTTTTSTAMEKESSSTAR